MTQAQDYNGLGLTPGCGYSIGITPHTPPPRRWSKETKGRVRKKRLESRLAKRLPLFAEQFAQAEISRRPQYFAGEDFDQCRSDHR